MGANNFDLIRLGLAGMVALVHVSVLSGEPGLGWIPRVISSDLAVKAFFVVSGFLIVMSYERSSGWRRYAGNRIRRIYPAYAAVILLSALLLVQTAADPIASYVSAGWWRYVAANLLFLNFLQPTLPGVFGANPLPTVNGALWTLKIEVGFYVIVPALVLACRRFGWMTTLGVTYAGSLAYGAAMRSLAASRGSDVFLVLAHQLPGQLAYFASGAALYYAWPRIRRSLVWLLPLAVAVLVGDVFRPLPAIEPAALGLAVVAAAFARPFGPISRYGDFSYGLYILHFPAIQLLIQSGWLAGRPVALLVAALALALAGATALWHLVEKPCLLPTSHYRRGGRD